MPEPEILNHAGDQVPPKIPKLVASHGVTGIQPDSQTLTNVTTELQGLLKPTGPDLEAKANHEDAVGTATPHSEHKGYSDDARAWNSLTMKKHEEQEELENAD